MHELGDQQPHLTIPAADGVHVLPQSLVRDVIRGTQSPNVLGDAVLQKIVQEWFDGLTRVKS